MFFLGTLKFHIPKILLHPSILNLNSRLFNPRVINVFFPSLKVRVKMVSINMKNGTMNMIFLAISQKICVKIIYTII